MRATVLIVDDHPGFRAVARTLLEAEGYDVVAESATGSEALDAAARLRPAVVLLDICLPDLNGIEVAERLTSNGASPAVVLTSSRDSCDYESLIEGCGARGFIPKADLCAEKIAALVGCEDAPGSSALAA